MQSFQVTKTKKQITVVIVNIFLSFLVLCLSAIHRKHGLFKSYMGYLATSITLDVTAIVAMFIFQIYVLRNLIETKEKAKESERRLEYIKHQVFISSSVVLITLFIMNRLMVMGCNLFVKGEEFVKPQSFLSGLTPYSLVEYCLLTIKLAVDTSYFCYKLRTKKYSCKEYTIITMLFAITVCSIVFSILNELERGKFVSIFNDFSLPKLFKLSLSMLSIVLLHKYVQYISNKDKLVNNKIIEDEFQKNYTMHSKVDDLAIEVDNLKFSTSLKMFFFDKRLETFHECLIDINKECSDNLKSLEKLIDINRSAAISSNKILNSKVDTLNETARRGIALIEKDIEKKIKHLRAGILQTKSKIEDHIKEDHNITPSEDYVNLNAQVIHLREKLHELGTYTNDMITGRIDFDMKKIGAIVDIHTCAIHKLNNYVFCLDNDVKSSDKTKNVARDIKNSAECIKDSFLSYYGRKYQIEDISISEQSLETRPVSDALTFAFTESVTAGTTPKFLPSV